MFLKSLKQGLLTIILALLFGIMTPKVFAMDYTVQDIELKQSEPSLISEDRLFNAVAVQTAEVTDGLMVNFGNGWKKVEISDQGYGPEALLFTSPTNIAEFKSDKPANLKAYVFFMDEIGGPDYQSENPDISNLQASTELAANNTFKVISRSEWGADESLRYWNPETEQQFEESGTTEKTYSDPCADVSSEFRSELEVSYVKESSPDGHILTWPLAYARSIRKFVIHHTDSEIRDINGDNRTDSRDYKAIVRAIYYYHTITRGWGDIGYNYIIDPLGNIYEGRYGGDKVIGAHALCYNNGSMGIAIIGNYMDDDVPEPALQSLITLLAVKAKANGIDPDGSSVFFGMKLPNILGHRDIRATSCPGDKLYNLLPKIRDRAALAIRSGTFSEGSLQIENLDYNAEPITDLSGMTLNPNELKGVVLRFKNIGKKTWDHNTWLHVALNNNPNARIIPLIEDRAFVAADLREKSVAPGETGTFDIQLEAGYYPGDYSFEVAPVVNGRYKVSRSSVDLAFTVAKPDFGYEVIKTDIPSGIVFQGQKIQASMELKNTGNVVWKNYGDNQIALGTSGPRDRKSIFIKDNPARIGYLFESQVEPGKTGHFLMDLEVPVNKTGTVVEQFTPVIENVSWLADKALGFKVNIKKPVHLAKINKLNDVGRLLPGEMKKIELSMENKGDLAWDMDNMQVTLLGRGIKVFKNKLVPIDPVKPGGTVNFDFWVEAPYEEGYNSVFLRGNFNKIPIRGGVARYLISVPKPSFRAELIDQGDQYVTLTPGQIKEVTVKFKNTGNIVWRNKGANAIYLGSSSPQDRLSRLYYKDGWENKYRPAVLNETVVYPGGTGTFTFKIKPAGKGVYKEYFQLVIENTNWIAGSGVQWYFRVFGDTAEDNSDNLKDAMENKKQAEIITSAKTATTTKSTTTTNTTPAEEPKTEYTPPTVTERPFRVRLSYAGETSTITSDKNFKVINDIGEELYTLSAGQEITITRIGNNIHTQSDSTAKSGTVIRLIPENGGVMEIKTWENRPSWNKELNDNKFREIIEIRVINDQAAYINELPLEDYLKGLAEVSNDSPFEKQKAIAVLARTYARFYMEDANRKFPGLPYDGSDDPAIFQRYLGYGVEIRSPNFVGAVAVTKDEAVTYQGKLIKTPYFNQSDGRTLSAKEVWGWTDTPYLQSVADPWCEGLVKRGHGVGMSGCGATGQANEGKTYDTIIKYYYQGVKVEELNFD
jgi:hypothetical protein